MQRSHRGDADAANVAPPTMSHGARHKRSKKPKFGGLAAAKFTGAAIPALPLKDTIKRVIDSHVIDTPLRAHHVAVQTPQVFRRDLLERALALSDEDVSDEAALIEHLGVRVAVFDGDERAFKVTTPLDFALARTLLSASKR